MELSLVGHALTLRSPKGEQVHAIRSQTMKT